MATVTALDAACLCACAKACHRREMRWGKTVYAGCRHHAVCHGFRPAGGPVADPTALILAAYDAHACLSCGSRYAQPFVDHGCGLLVPVTVTVARREASVP